MLVKKLKYSTPSPTAYSTPSPTVFSGVFLFEYQMGVYKMYHNFVNNLTFCNVI